MSACSPVCPYILTACHSRRYFESIRMKAMLKDLAIFFHRSDHAWLAFNGIIYAIRYYMTPILLKKLFNRKRHRRSCLLTNRFIVINYLFSLVIALNPSTASHFSAHWCIVFFCDKWRLFLYIYISVTLYRRSQTRFSNNEYR